MSGVWGRIVLLGALCAAIVLLLAQTQYYATALVLAGIAALIANRTRQPHVEHCAPRGR